MIQPDNNDQMRGRGALRFRNLAIAAVALAVLFTASTSHRARADDPDFLRLAVGFYDINDNQEAVEVRAEYQSDFKLWFVKPFIGIMGTTDAAVYGYGGLLTDIYFGRRWVLTPSLAVGGYRNGDGKDLGHVIEFRSSIELAYRFDNREPQRRQSGDRDSQSQLLDPPGLGRVELRDAAPISLHRKHYPQARACAALHRRRGLRGRC